MKVLIIGAGLIGVTAAYCLRRRRHEVTVIDRRSAPGREASYANGGLLTPSMAEPWNTPGCERVLLGSLGRSDGPLQLRLHALPDLIGWGIRFLRNSRPGAYQRNTLSNLRLAIYSLEGLGRLRQETGIEYGHAARGALKLFRNEAALAEAASAADSHRAEGVRFRVLSAKDTADMEPALAPIADRIKGAIHYERDETGDALRFCEALADHAAREGVEFRFGTEIRGLEVRSNRVSAVPTEGERFVADRIVVAAGSYSTPLLRTVGVRLPVRPAKGYSITFDPPEREPALRIPVIDDELHAAVVPIDRVLRVAGTAEFAGYDLTMRPERVRNLISLLQNVLPQAQIDPASGRPWCGLRPMSADGVPIIGATPVPNLFMSTGHGHLGWTLAAGSAELLCDLVSGKSPQIDPTPFGLDRFQGRRGRACSR